MVDSPDAVKAVHRSYIDVGCDAVCTNTWGLPTALRDGGHKLAGFFEPVHWMDIVRRAVRLAREAAAEAGREHEVAVAFSINGDVDTPDGRETIRLLARAFEEEPPDLMPFAPSQSDTNLILGSACGKRSTGYAAGCRRAGSEPPNSMAVSMRTR